MNERIKELMIEHNIHVDFKDSEYVFEKFAELIIQECARVSIDSEINSSGDFREGIAQSIRQHFGVE